MKINVLLMWLIVCCLCSCNEEPDITLERKPIPVIYSMFNKYDTVNYLYITKTWSGDNGGSLVTAKNPDSIYFRNVAVTIDLIQNVNSIIQHVPDTVHVDPEFIWRHDKKPGIFMYPDYPVFALRYNLENFDAIICHISIQGYNTIVLNYNLLPKPVFYSPNNDGMLITILPKQNLTVKYSATTQTEVRLFCEIITKTPTELFSDTISIRKVNIGSPVSFSYGNLLSAINLQVKNHPDVEYSQFGKLGIEIWTGDGNFPGLIPEKENFAFIDFTLPGSPWVPELFVFGGTIATNKLANLELDYPTKENIAQDTSLSQFKFVKW